MRESFVGSDFPPGRTYGMCGTAAVRKGEHQVQADCAHSEGTIAHVEKVPLWRVETCKNKHDSAPIESRSVGTLAPTE